MNMFFDRPIKRLLNGSADGELGKRAVLTAHAWRNSRENLITAISILEQNGLPTDGSAQPRPQAEQDSDAQALPEARKQLQHAKAVAMAYESNARMVNQAVRIANPSLPQQPASFAPYGYESARLAGVPAAQQLVDEIVGRVRYDWAIANIASLREQDDHLKSEAQAAFKSAPSLAERTFDDFAAQVADNAKFIDNAISQDHGLTM